MEQNRALGITAAVSAFTIWGLFPFYWIPLSSVPALEIIWHRIVWSAVLAWGIVLWRRAGGKTQFRMFGLPRRVLFITFGNGVLISVNWLTYVYAVTNGHTVDASLGYYIGPLVSIALGTVVLHESLSPLRRLAVASAAIGVVSLAVRVGSFPWISLVLAFSFSLYGLIKKTVPLNAVEALAVETAPVSVIAVIFMGVGLVNGTSHLTGHGAAITLLLIGAGVVTLLPLALFGAAARRIMLSEVGFIQYITPTAVLLIGTLVLGEPFDRARAGGFVLVWLGLALFTMSNIRRRRS